MIEAICISPTRGTRKSPVSEATLQSDHGLVGDAHAGPSHRQVSLLALSDIETMRARGATLPPGAFGENLIVSACDLSPLGIGSRLRLGAGAELIVTQRGKECHTRCDIYFLTGDCIMPRRGIFCRVSKGGVVVAGDAIEVVETRALEPPFPPYRD